ncbi:MAG TPA: hypothetical protein VNV43_12010 [Candidatus Acidoferrales bacterium]|jgi:hypothetical protein|nr:hypothetical protein [Candidatus Acidoferrales bacterium]
MSLEQTNNNLHRLEKVLTNFGAWLDAYGETSWDHQSYYAGQIGGRAKALYYKNKWLGIAAVAPMVFSEAFFPPARRLFHHRMRLPIADAHYAMGFAYLYQATGDQRNLERAVHFLEVLRDTRCPDFKEFCWGYPFDWVTRNGTIRAHTPLITTTPYVFEAFLQVYQLQPRDEWKETLESIVRHATTDIKDFKSSESANTSSYTPFDKGGVVNASAYRSFMLTSAAKSFDRDDLIEIARGNLNFVLDSQNADGSWPYAKDGVRNFVDHFHTCFVMKALAKIYALTAEPDVIAALKGGVDYYINNLFAEDGMPRPFSKAPRLTVYQCELYDCAECINLCLLLRSEFPELNKVLETVTGGILENWIKADGSFRSRKLIFGWDNVPMHRWAQSQMFRSLAFLAAEQRTSFSKPAVDKLSRAGEQAVTWKF